jgi:hypothetical protein
MLPFIWTTGHILPWFRNPPLQDYHRVWDMHGTSVTSTKFRVLPSDFFPLLFFVDILPVLQLLQVFSFEALPALSPAYTLHNAASLSLHPVLPLSTVMVTVCCLDALLAESNTHISQHFIGHHRPLLSPLQFAIWKHSCHCVTHALLKASSAIVVPLFSCHLSDHCHASHGSSFLVRVLRWTA